MSLARRVSAVAVATCLSLGVGVGVAGASGLTSSTSVSIDLSSHGKVTTKSLAQLLADYQTSLTRINQSYGQRIAQAHAKYVKSLAKAKSAADKLHARATYRTAVVMATTEREVELEILGSPPGTADQSPGDGQMTVPGDN